MYRIQQILSILLIGFIFLINNLYGQENNNNESQINFIKYHNIDKAWCFSKGQNVKVAILDWMFNIKSDSSDKYINPTSLVPGQDIGVYDPWHGEWMAGIVHQIAPDCKIIPVRARPKSEKNENSFVNRPYEKYVIEGIRFAADHGAAVVTNSMGPLKQSDKLDEVIKYAEEKGTVFIDVHPEYLKFENNSYVFCDSTQLNDLIIHSGIVSVPAHPRKIDPLRDICTWPYDINPKFKDGWGYSNGPPIFAGVVALMKSVNNDLTVIEIKKIIVETSRNENGFKVLDAEAAVKAALKKTYTFTGVSCKQDRNVPGVIRKGNVTYDFRFAELAIKYLETDDSIYIEKIATLEATDHIMNHAKHFDYDVPKNSNIDLVSHLLSPFNKKKKILNDFKRNLKYAKDSIAQVDLAQKICLQYLPDGFKYSSKLFYTFGYDLGVVFGPNASLNLAHPHYLKDMREIKYYSIHELHHAGFVILKQNYVPTIDISTYKEMTKLIEYFTHLEGMGTYAPLEIRKKENAMNNDKDYIALQDSALMKADEKEYFEIYFHFKNNPEKLLTEGDWEKLSILSNKKRLWYRVGAEMAEKIDKDLGRQKLTGLIPEPSENFINTYLMLKDR